MSGEYLRKSVEVSKGIVGTFVLCAACAATDTIGRMWTRWIVATVAASAHAMTRNRFTEDLLGMPCYTLPPYEARSSALSVFRPASGSGMKQCGPAAVAEATANPRGSGEMVYRKRR